MQSTSHHKNRMYKEVTGDAPANNSGAGIKINSWKTKNRQSRKAGCRFVARVKGS